MAPGMNPDSPDSVLDDGDAEDIWDTIRNEAKTMIKEPTDDFDFEAANLLPSFIESSILQWNTLEECFAAHISMKLGRDHIVPVEKWKSVLTHAFLKGANDEGEPLSSLIRADLRVIKERDPACPGFAHALLFFKGFQGLQLYRASHYLWKSGKRSLASLIQSATSELFGMDIHPGARIGKGILIDHGTGVVIGETAVVGSGCTLLHSVTLGGTGKDSGDRHPKLGKNVLVGAGSSILGNVKIGDGAKIGAAALVLSDIPPQATAVGSPAKVVGKSKEANPAKRMDLACHDVDFYKELQNVFCPFRHLKRIPFASGCSKQLGPYEFITWLENLCKKPINKREALELFFELDKDGNGKLTEEEVSVKIHQLEDFVIPKLVKCEN